MFNPSTQPRILFATPEVTFIPVGSGNHSDYINSRSEGFAGFLSNLVGDLYERGADVHITQPDYRKVFTDIIQNSCNIAVRKMPKCRVHLTEDRTFFYANNPESNYKWENIKISLAFQREVINHILPLVQPDLIHCHNWMTGLIPAIARVSRIPCIFTVQNLDTGKSQLSIIEDLGIDAAAFWQQLFFDRFPANYEETRETNPIDFLLSGIFAANFVSVAEPAFAGEMNKDRSPYSELLNQILVEKLKSGSADVNRNTSVDAKQYFDLYERMLQRPLIKIKTDKFEVHTDFPHRGKKINKAYNKDQVSSGNFSPLVLSV